MKTKKSTKRDEVLTSEIVSQARRFKNQSAEILRDMETGDVEAMEVGLGDGFNPFEHEFFN